MDPYRARLAGAWEWLPRAGGDGPPQTRAAWSMLTAPPRRRGWTRPSVMLAAPFTGSPAQAGMDPAGALTLASPRRLPRAGGDGPPARRDRGGHCVAPPRRRGWTRGHAPRTAGARGSPAQAGMDPTVLPPGPHPRGLPRAGGDGPCGAGVRGTRTRAPPRRRGWTLPRGRGPTSWTGSPAQAGMDPASRASRWARARLPRAGGDGPRRRGAGRSAALAPPRRRGWTRADASAGA